MKDNASRDISKIIKSLEHNEQGWVCLNEYNKILLKEQSSLLLV